MMITSHPQQSVWSALAVVGCGVLLLFAPDRVGDTLRKGVRDLLAPALQGAATLRERTETWSAVFARSRELQLENDRLKTELRLARLKSRTAVAKAAAATTALEEWKRSQPAQAGYAERGEPLLLPRVIEARVLGMTSGRFVRAETLLEHATPVSLEESLVMADVLLDQGDDSGVSAGRPVLQGATIVGRIARSGRLISSLQPVTHKEFRGLAQIVRYSQSGAQLGARGVLEGDGRDRCRMKFVPAEQPVAVGDLVFLPPDELLHPTPLYYGRIVSATLPPGAPHWEIEIAPAGDGLNLDRVQILHPESNPARILAH